MRISRNALLRGVLALALALVAITFLLQLSRISKPPWWGLMELFGVGVLVLHKRLAGYTPADEGPHSPLKGFFKAFLSYFLPVSFLWSLFTIDFFTRYAPRLGFVPTPLLVSISVSVGFYLLLRVLLQREMRELAAPRHDKKPN